MATFKAEVRNDRADGTYDVKIRVRHNRVVRRIATKIFVTAADLTRKTLKIKNTSVLDKCEDVIKKCRTFCNDLSFQLNRLTVDELVAQLKNNLEGGDRFRLDLI